MIFMLMKLLPPGYILTQTPWGKLPISLERCVHKTAVSIIFHKKTINATPSITQPTPQYPEISKPGAGAVTEA